MNPLMEAVAYATIGMGCFIVSAVLFFGWLS